MSRKAWYAFVVVLSIALGLVVITSPPSAHADPSATIIPWPNIPLPYAAVRTHGDNSFTIADDSCTSTSNGTPSVVTENAALTVTNAEVQGSDGWVTTNCDQTTVSGTDGAIYFVQRNTIGTQRLVALRNNVMIWTAAFNICGSNTSIKELKLGYDGDLYALVNGSCNVLMLVGLNGSTGKQKFTTQLPSSNSSTADEIRPYDAGIAVRNNGSRVYYYTYDGVAQPLLTFIPSTQYISYTAGTIAVSVSGRTFMIDPGGHTLFYKDIDSQVIHAISFSSSDTLMKIFATPANGVVANVSRNGVLYFEYFDATGTELYEKNLYSDSRGNPTTIYRSTVDSLGNYIVERGISLPTRQNDQDIFLDSFDPSGTATQLFDSGSIEGSSTTTDYFSSPSQDNGIPLQLANGKAYLPLCYYGAPLGGGPATSCLHPSLVSIPIPGSFDYPRSAIFAAQAAKPNYVALGDSYSSAQGNPPFIAPSDTDGCDRSPAAYSTLVALAINASLRAFVACSGATSDEIYTGMNGEPSQLDSLDANTNIVTVTAGGDDAGFPDFAFACVNPTTNCGTDSSAYATAMDYVNNYLQANLELLYGRIRSAAPNATVYVVGYPQVAPEPGGTCTYFTDSEKTAARNLVTAIDAKALAAVQDSGANFQFVDPTQAGSPFTGHEICTDDPYFNNVTWTETDYSFHPNAAGQSAYAQLILDAM